MKFIQIESAPPTLFHAPRTCMGCPFNLGLVTCRLYRRSLRGVSKNGRPDWCAVIGFHIVMNSIDPRILNLPSNPEDL